MLFQFHVAKAFANGNIKICEMRVEQLADEMIATSCPMFATEWHDFYNFSSGPSLMTFFTGSPPVAGLAFFTTSIQNHHEAG